MAETHQPQLVMGRERLDELPAVEVPSGATLRSYSDGDDRHWRRIIAESFGWEWSAEEFEQRFRGAPAFRPERVLFVCWQGEPVGTATVWQVPGWGDDCAYLHMVGVTPAATGRRLGALVSLACLHHMRAEGFARCLLQTDDHRLPAVRTYLNLGFRPLLVHDNQRERWPRLLASVGWADYAARRDWAAEPLVERAT